MPCVRDPVSAVFNQCVCNSMIRRPIFLVPVLLFLPALVLPKTVRGAEPGAFTLEEAWRRTAAADPELAALESSLRVMDARREQAGRLSNPELGLTVENALGSGAYRGFDGAETTLTLSQSFPLMGRLGREAGAVDADRARLVAEIELRRRKIAGEVVSTFVELLGHREHVRHIRQAVELAERFVSAATSRVNAGAAPPAEKLRAEIALRDATFQLRRGEIELEGSRQRLAMFWGAVSPDFPEPAAEFGRLPDLLPPLENLVLEAEAASLGPVWERELVVRESRRDLERSRRLPDFRLEAGVRRLEASSDGAMVAGLSMPLPVFDRNRGAIREAEELVARTATDRNSERKRLLSELAGAYSRLRVNHEEALVLRNELLPRGREALEQVLEGYRRGRFGLADVTDTEQHLHELLERQHDALTGFHQAAASIESLTAKPLYEGSITFLPTGETRP